MLGADDGAENCRADLLAGSKVGYLDPPIGPLVLNENILKGLSVFHVAIRGDLTLGFKSR